MTEQQYPQDEPSQDQNDLLAEELEGEWNIPIEQEHGLMRLHDIEVLSIDEDDHKAFPGGYVCTHCKGKRDRFMMITFQNVIKSLLICDKCMQGIYTELME